MLRMIAKLLRVLNSETDPRQISMAFCFSMVAGFTPLFSLHNLFVLFLVLLIRVNISAFLLGLLFFTGIAYLLDPLFHSIGLTALTASAMKSIWTAMYNSTIWRLEKFNNSVVMGSLVFSLVLFIPLFYLNNFFIVKYREHILEWVQKSRIMQALKASKFYSIYRSVSGWRG